MLEALTKVLKDISTGIDGTSYCCTRIYGHFGVTTYLGLCIADFAATHAFNYVAFGTGFAAIVAGQGVALLAKKDTEPKG